MRTFHLKPCATLFAATAMVMVVAAPLAAASASKSTDRRIEAAAKDSYNFRTHLKNDKITVTAEAGMVTLTGTVARDYHKVLADETVAGLPGVKGVSNQLSIEGFQLTDQSDGWISAKVKASLSYHKNVSATQTSVRTTNGVVTLTGKVESEAQKALTGEYAKDVEGVTEVRNELVLTDRPATKTLGERVDDASITAQVKTSLLFRKSTHALTTKITTRKGVVTVTGEAKNAAEKDLVTKLAEDVQGVKQVNNRMTTL